VAVRSPLRACRRWWRPQPLTLTRTSTSFLPVRSRSNPSSNMETSAMHFWPTSSLKGTETSDRARDQCFFEFARSAPPRRPRWGTQTFRRGRHLFREHCPVTPAPMFHLRIAAGIQQPSWEQSPVPDKPNGVRGPLVRAAIGISAPFRQMEPSPHRGGPQGNPHGQVFARLGAASKPPGVARSSELVLGFRARLNQL